MSAASWPAERAEALAAVGGWFEGLAAYGGPLAPDDPIVAGGQRGWVLSTLGRELAVVVGQDFPFSKPQVYVRGSRPHIPHVERDGRICLNSPEVPSDPVRSVMSAVASARSLLQAVEDARVPPLHAPHHSNADRASRSASAAARPAAPPSDPNSKD